MNPEQLINKVTKLLYGNQQKFNIKAVNDYPPIRFERKFPIRTSLNATGLCGDVLLDIGIIGHGLASHYLAK